MLSRTFGVYLHTLGCPKNEADSDGLSRRLVAAGVRLVPSPEDASHIVVNTCGFIEAAREESIGAILEAAQAYPRARLLVMGCLVERHREELAAGLPEVTGWFGLTEAARLERLLASDQASVGASSGLPAPTRPDAVGEAPTFAYIKISDGCDHHCTFCAIPAIKGPYAPLPARAVREQVGAALDEGALELVLVGQDTAIWRDGDLDLLGLVGSLGEDPRVARVRLLYLQPEHVTARLLESMAGSPTLCRYLDIPFQHASPGILRRMGRSGDGGTYLDLLRSARAVMPDVSLRSTFIVGFPGETEDDVEVLLDFIAEARFDHAGVFSYSPEEGTPASTFGGHVPPEVAEERMTRVGQALIDSGEMAAAGRVGHRVSVIVESLDSEGAPEGTWAAGRTCGQAPDIDGVAFLAGSAPAGAATGLIVEGTVEETAGFDLLVRADDTDGSP